MLLARRCFPIYLNANYGLSSKVAMALIWPDTVRKHHSNGRVEWLRILLPKILALLIVEVPPPKLLAVPNPRGPRLSNLALQL